MKILNTLIGISMFAFAYNANAATITINDGGIYDNTVVGGVDTFIEAASKVGSETAEETWVNSVLFPNDTASFTVKLEEDIPYYSTDVSNTYAISLLDTDPRPDYFLVKNATFMALFENEAYVGWGVFDTTDIVIDDGTGNLVPLDMNLATKGFTVSHVTLFESDGGRGLCNPSLDPTCLSSVPIPPAVWLFASGIIGLVGVARRAPIA